MALIHLIIFSWVVVLVTSLRIPARTMEEIDLHIDSDMPHKQQDVNAYLWKIYEPLQTNRLNALTTDFSPVADLSLYSDEGEAAKKLCQECEDGNVLAQKNYFSIFNTRHRQEAVKLFEVLISCKDWDPCFRNNAAYFRERLNEGVFTYALYTAVIHHPIANGVVLPPLYEVTPHMFTNSEIINKAYTAKMTQTPGKFKMSYTGSQKNPELRVAYFVEDIGMNVHHITWHMEFPFWWKDSYGYNLDRKGELFFWANLQLSARFNAERLSNHLDVVKELHWDHPLCTGVSPHITYKYDGEFPARPDEIQFRDVGIARIRDLMIWENRIRDAIAHGYVTGHNGTINLLNKEGIDIIGSIIEPSEYSSNPEYYGSLHNTARIVIGHQGDPCGKYNQPPGVIEHFETAARDPAFFRLHEYMSNIFKEIKDRLPPYTYDELNFEGVDLEKVTIEESLETYFEDFEFSLINAVETTPEIEDVEISAVVKRLNHKPFTFNIQVINNNHVNVVSCIRINICPHYDNNYIPFEPSRGRWGCIQLDKFWTELTPGENTIVRHSSESSVTVPDNKPFDYLIKKADAAVAAGQKYSGLEEDCRRCGIPARLLLPKGNEEGLEFFLIAFINDGSHDHTESIEDGRYSGAHSLCGIHGQKYPDSQSMGFPDDRRQCDLNLISKVSNIYKTTVKIYHKQSE